MRMGSCISRMSLLLLCLGHATRAMRLKPEMDADIVWPDTPARTPSALLPKYEAMQR